MNAAGYNFFAFGVLAAWVPVILALFAILPARRAVIASFLFGYLFLPDMNIVFHTLPDVNKVSLTAFGVILGSLIFDGGRLFAVRPRLIDLACLVLCFCPVVTSLTNGLGLMDGLDASINLIFRWGFAYWIGRAYFTDWEGMRELALGIILGGLVYAPLCWWEIRMSPQLHGQIYGWLFQSFRTDSNLFGYRPNVFLADGLTVTMFMGMTALLAFWFWLVSAPRHLFGVPMGWIALFLIVTTIFCKAFGGMVLMGSGMGALMAVKYSRTKVAVLILMLIGPAYMITRSTGDWSGNRLVELIGYYSETRAQSFGFRLHNEDLLAAKALQQPWFGWGGWSRSHVFDEWGKDLTIVDGLWIILLGEHGIVGLASFCLMVLGSAYLLWKRIPTRYWIDAACAAPVALAVVITLYVIDGLANATFNPVASLAVGAVASMSFVAKRTFAPQPLRVARALVQPAAVVSSIKDLPYAYSPSRP